MNNWKYVKLSTLCSKIGDGLHGTPEYLDDSDIYFINGNNLKKGKIEITENTRGVSEEVLLSNFIKLDSNTLLLSINGTLGSMAFYNNEKVVLGKSTAYLNFKIEINRFYYYYFQLDNIQKYFYDVATGSTIKNLSLKSLQDFQVPLPEENEWKNISKILSSLDSKIELNNRINAELEAMAKTLYDYWFVQFDFPYSPTSEGCLQDGVVGKPYKSSGGAMVWNEELKREIPEGWEVKSFGNYSKSKGGFAFKSEWWSESGIPVIKIKDIQENYTLGFSDISFVSEDKYDITKSFEVSAGDVVIAMTGATVGKYGIVPIKDKPILVNQRVAFFDLGKEPILKLPFLINSLNQKYFRDTVFSLASGAAQPNISNTQIDGIPLVIPSREIIDSYNLKLAPVYKTILNNQAENQKLSELRDWLLPMLMNGQVRVK